QMRDRIQRLTDELLDAALARGRGRMDLIRDYALPVPTTIISEMLGVPPEDGHRFHRGSNAVVAAGASKWALFRAVPSVLGLLRFIGKLIKRRRADPRDDLLSA